MVWLIHDAALALRWTHSDDMSALLALKPVPVALYRLRAFNDEITAARDCNRQLAVTCQCASRPTVPHLLCGDMQDFLMVPLGGGVDTAEAVKLAAAAEAVKLAAATASADGAKPGVSDGGWLGSSGGRAAALGGGDSARWLLLAAAALGLLLLVAWAVRRRRRRRRARD